MESDHKYIAVNYLGSMAISTPSTTVSTPKSAANGRNSVADPISEIGRLSDACEEWDKGIYERSNKELYNILAGCLNIYNQIKSNHNACKAVTKYLEKCGLKYNSGTHLSTRVIRAVFRSSGARCDVYARVIRAAIDEKVDATSLSDWISNQGGVEQVRRKAPDGVTPSEARKDVIEQTQDKLMVAGAKAILGPLSFIPPSSATGTRPFWLALVRADKSGSHVIVGATANDSLIGAVLARVSKEVIAESTSKSAAVDERQRAQEKSTAISHAVVPAVGN